jgi:hypothetical protein
VNSLQQALRGDAQAKEDAIKRAMEFYGCGVDDLTLEIYMGGIWRVRYLPHRETRWLDWHSDNHGWGAPLWDRSTYVDFERDLHAKIAQAYALPPELVSAGPRL